MYCALCLDEQVVNANLFVLVFLNRSNLFCSRSYEYAFYTRANLMCRLVSVFFRNHSFCRCIFAHRLRRRAGNIAGMSSDSITASTLPFFV